MSEGTACLGLYSSADIKTDFRRKNSSFALAYKIKTPRRFHVLGLSDRFRRSSLVATPKIIHRMIFVCWLRFVGPLPPVLISRYAKNHSPDDFCLRHYALCILHCALSNILNFEKKLSFCVSL